MRGELMDKEQYSYDTTQTSDQAAMIMPVPDPAVERLRKRLAEKKKVDKRRVKCFEKNYPSDDCKKCSMEEDCKTDYKKTETNK